MASEIVNTPAVTRQLPSPQGKVKLDMVGTGSPRVSDTPKAESGKVTAVPELESIQIKLEASVSRLKDYAQSIKRELQFTIDEESGRTVIIVLDSQTNEIIRLIPSEEVLALAKNIESMKGVLFSAEV